MAPKNRPRVSQIAKFPAATAGWISNQNLANPPSSPQGAAVLDNVFPTATGGTVRRGSNYYAQLGDGVAPVTAIFSYNNGNNRKLFASTASTIYDITVISSSQNLILGTEDGDALVDDFNDPIGTASTEGLDIVTGQTGGFWIVTQFATTGGVYLVCVNGEDALQLYDGSSFYPINGESISSFLFTGETAPFTVGATLTGGTSGATATIVRVISNGTSGTMLVGDITGGPFVDAETITDGSGGSASVDGATTQLFVGITGVDTSELDYVWVYKNRLFFVQKDSMNAWYLPVDLVGGVADSFPLGGVFTLGGKLLFGAAWSLDSSGSGGLSEQCVFISDQGEVAVYQGLGPSEDDWTKVGSYRIGKPLGPQAWIKAGGDLVIATDIGAVPLSQAIQRDYAALSPSAVSYPIETAWNEAVEARRSGRWHCLVWPERQMVVVAPPTVNEQQPEMYVANARTGAWGRFTNWNGTCLEVFNGRMFFGSENGNVIEAYVTGLDLGDTYTAAYVPLFVDFNTSAALKVAEIARSVTRGPQDITPQLSVMADYTIDLPSPPPASVIDTGSEWGTGIWGESVWGSARDVKVQQEWTSVGGVGYALAPSLQITSGSIVPLDTEIIRLELTYDTSDIVA